MNILMSFTEMVVLQVTMKDGLGRSEYKAASERGRDEQVPESMEELTQKLRVTQPVSINTSHLLSKLTR